jgi:hypothetical protein
LHDPPKPTSGKTIDGSLNSQDIGGREAADAFWRRLIEIQIRSEWNLGVLSFRPTLECFWLERFPKGKA